MNNVLDTVFLIVGLLQIPLAMVCLYNFFKRADSFVGSIKDVSKPNSYNIKAENVQINGGR